MGLVAPVGPILGRVEVACRVPLGQSDQSGRVVRDDIFAAIVTGQLVEKRAQAGAENDGMAGDSSGRCAAKDQVIRVDAVNDGCQICSRDFRKIGQ